MIGCAARRRAGKSARAFRDIRQELSDLKRVSLLLQELIVVGLIEGLLGLLAERTGTKKGLSACKACLLTAAAKSRERLGDVLTSAKIALTQSLLGLSRAHKLLVSLLAQSAVLLGGLEGLLEGLLTKLAHRLGQSHWVLEGSLPKAAIGLRGCERVLESGGAKAL